MLILIIATKHLSINLVSRHFFATAFFKSSKWWWRWWRRRDTQQVIRLIALFFLFILYYGSIDGRLRLFSIIFQLNFILPFENWKNKNNNSNNTLSKPRYSIRVSFPSEFLFEFAHRVINFHSVWAHFLSLVITLITANVFTVQISLSSLSWRMRIVYIKNMEKSTILCSFFVFPFEYVANSFFEH